MDMKEDLESIICRLLGSRKGVSICPSEVARMAFEDDWRDHMSIVLEVAGKMAKQNQIEICQKGIVVDSDTAKGPIRFRLPPDLNL